MIRRRRADAERAGSGTEQAQAIVLARPRRHRGRGAGADDRAQGVRRAGVLHPLRVDGEHPAARRPHPGQQDRLPTSGRSRAATSWCSAAPGPGTRPRSRRPTRWLRLWDDAAGLVGIAAPSTDYVKRVIGVPGDHVVCCDAQGRITVNGVPLSESSYIYPGAVPSADDVRHHRAVGAAVGDGRQPGGLRRLPLPTSFPGGGTIPESAVVGRAFVIIWPLSRVVGRADPRDLQAGWADRGVPPWRPPRR